MGLKHTVPYGKHFSDHYVNLLYALVQAFAKEKKHTIIILFSEMFPVFSL